MLKNQLLIAALLVGTAVPTLAQEKMKPEDTEVWEPVPPVVNTPVSQAPSDAVVLFDGKDLSAWESQKNPGQPAEWTVGGGTFTVNKEKGNIWTKEKFGSYQLHLEYYIPIDIDGEGQGRGNSGLFLAAIGSGDEGYELQILDSYENKTYVNGQLGSVYKQKIPLANPARKPGEWQTYDVVWTAPEFKEDGSLGSPARVTVLINGVLVQNNVELEGGTQYIGKPSYKAHGPAPIMLQSHGDPSKPISFRNIWVRPL
ncbi:DUF1080 domain-containing protein [Olivibacter sp. SDN3]|uniref:3-keto-disaccharide hydrolase n=1 Tax=Olivibacter sp. SDN3 TaxID=2764720 RepID=UPI0016511F5D|nr:DUF1080 domain-containing protein [Olivibacter sp. SDN3]QNL51564.1 DUF1080 domain-containing protein [Olivibacter sp. SDN3]